MSLFESKHLYVSTFLATGLRKQKDRRVHYMFIIFELPEKNL